MNTRVFSALNRVCNCSCVIFEGFCFVDFLVSYLKMHLKNSLNIFTKVKLILENF